MVWKCLKVLMKLTDSWHSEHPWFNEMVGNRYCVWSVPQRKARAFPELGAAFIIPQFLSLSLFIKYYSLFLLLLNKYFKFVFQGISCKILWFPSKYLRCLFLCRGAIKISGGSAQGLGHSASCHFSAMTWMPSLPVLLCGFPKAVLTFLQASERCAAALWAPTKKPSPST